MKTMKLTDEWLRNFTQAGENQVGQIILALKRKGIEHSLEDVAMRVAVAMHSYVITDKIIKEIEKAPGRTLANMSMKEKFEAAGMRSSQVQTPEGREKSRKILESIRKGSTSDERSR